MRLLTLTLPFLLVATAGAQTVTIGPAVFSGTGLNDATSGGRYTPAPANTVYVVTISATGTPDHFTWTKNAGSASSPAAITSSAITLTDGVTIQFAATTGHTLADRWFIVAQASGSLGGSSFVQRGAGAVVARDAEDKLRETVTPEDFGAVGDCITNDSAAWQAADNYLTQMFGGGKIQAQPKCYIANMTIDTAIWIAGANVGMTTLKSAPGSNLDVIEGRGFATLTGSYWHVPETRGANFTVLSDLTIDGNKANNSAGYGIRIWGHSMYWDKITVQNAVQDGIFTQYSDGTGPQAFLSNPKNGDSTGYFYKIKSLRNGGNGWTDLGPNDIGVSSYSDAENGGAWGFQNEGNYFLGTASTIGTALTLSSPGPNPQLNSGANIELGGGLPMDVYAIASCSSRTSCTLTAAPSPALSGASAFAVQYNGGLDTATNWSSYNENGCYDFGPLGGVQSMVGIQCGFSTNGILDEYLGGTGQKVDVVVENITNAGVTLTGPNNHFDGSVNNSGVGLVLNSFGGGNAIKISGQLDGVGVQLNTENAADRITGIFDTPSSLNDATSGGTYTGTGLHQYSIQIDSQGAPDTFQWKKDTGAWTTGVSVTGSAQVLADGVTVTFAATTGHSTGTVWIVQALSAPSPSVGPAMIERLFFGLPGGGNYANDAIQQTSLNLQATGADDYTILQIPTLYDKSLGQNLLQIPNFNDPTLNTGILTDPGGNTTLNASYGLLPGVWAPSTVFGLGVNIHDANGHIMTVTTAGTSGAVQPNPSDSGLSTAWNEKLGFSCTLGGSPPCTTTDGSVIWTDTIGLAANLYLMNAGGDVLIGPNLNVAAPYRFQGSGNAIDLGCQLFPAASCSWGLNNGSASLSLLLFGHLNAGCPDCGGVFSTSYLYFGPNSQVNNGFRVNSAGTGLISLESFSGNPNGSISAGPGSLGFDVGGNLWFKPTGSGNTGWVNASPSMGAVGGASNLTSVFAIPYVSATGVLNEDPNIYIDTTNDGVHASSFWQATTQLINGAGQGNFTAGTTIGGVVPASKAVNTASATTGITVATSTTTTTTCTATVITAITCVSTSASTSTPTDLGHVHVQN